MDFLDAFKAAADPFKRSLLRQQQAAQSVDPVAQLRRAYFSRQLQSQVQPSMSQGPLPWDPGTSESMREAHPIEKLPRIDPESQTPLGYIAKATGDLESTLGTPLENVDAPLRGIQQAAIAWHGSPALFDAFDYRKIGTGEGAQAYGHGLYFAENPAVAREYTRAGRNVGFLNWDDVDTIAKKAYAQTGTGTKEEAIQLLRNKMDEMRPGSRKNNFEFAIRAIERGDVGPGMYKVDIPDEEIAQMLDWDKPLSDQPHILEAIKNIKIGHTPVDSMSREQLIKQLSTADPNGVYADSDTLLEFGEITPTEDLRKMAKEMELDEYLSSDLLNDAESRTGKSLYYQLVSKLGGKSDAYSGEAQRLASELLRDAGIPGIKYLDQGSRGAGKGTRNLVKFSDQNIKILEINGKPVSKEVLEAVHNPLIKPLSEIRVEDLPRKGTLADYESVFLGKLDEAGRKEWNDWKAKSGTLRDSYTRDEFIDTIKEFNDRAKRVL